LQLAELLGYDFNGKGFGSFLRLILFAADSASALSTIVQGTRPFSPYLLESSSGAVAFFIFHSIRLKKV
jgi:hypothetical protein